MCKITHLFFTHVEIGKGVVLQTFLHTYLTHLFATNTPLPKTHLFILHTLFDITHISILHCFVPPYGHAGITREYPMMTREADDACLNSNLKIGSSLSHWALVLVSLLFNSILWRASVIRSTISTAYHLFYTTYLPGAFLLSFKSSRFPWDAEPGVCCFCKETT